MLVNGDITSSQFQEAKAQRELHLKAGRRFTRIREPYFFGYVEDLLQQEYGTNTVRSGGLKVYTTIAPGLQRAATAAITHVLTEPTDPASAIVSIDPRTGAIRAMTAVTPGHKGNQFNFATSARRQPGSTFKVITLTAAVARGMDPFAVSYLSAPFHYQPDSTCNPSDPNCAWNVQTYDHTYSGDDLRRERDVAVRQHGVRAARARRRAGEHRHDGAEARHPVVARAAARRSAVDHARLDRRDAARDGVRVRDARRRRHVLEADGDHAGRAAEREGRHERAVGQAAARARDPRTGSRRR